MKKWYQYQKERFPLLFYVPFAAVFVYSTMSFTIHQSDGRTKFSVSIFLFLWFIILSFFALFRIADEYKDYDKDCMLHPERPVQRKLISLAELGKAGIVILAMQVLLTVFTHAIIIKLYILTLLYFLLMIKEFYIPVFLEHHPIIYGALHQNILIILDFLIIFTTKNTHQNLLRRENICFAVSRFLCFFSIYAIKVIKNKRQLEERNDMEKVKKLAYIVTAAYLLLTCMSGFFQR